MVIYLSEHYKKLPATGFNTGLQHQAEAAAAAVPGGRVHVAHPSEYHTLKQGGEAEASRAVKPATLYDEVVRMFGECGIKVTSDGEAAYAADRRAIMLIVLSPELFKCAELVDEIAGHLDGQAEANRKAAGGSSKDMGMNKSLLSGAAEQKSRTYQDLLRVDEVPLEMMLDAETKLDAFEVGASVVFGLRSARPGQSRC